MTVDQDQDPLIGTKVGPCRVEARLAAGGMGVVYRAHHAPTDQSVALKVLAPSLAADQEYVTRFFREAGAAGQIDHPNVVRVIDVGRHQDMYYLVMEFVQGDTLDRTLENDGRMGLERATRLVRDIASGLAAAHRAGIIHRDVKPGNVIVSRDGRPHLTDFGLARHAQTRKGLTIEGTFLGTPEYSSPEQVEGRKLDHRTDLYSLGVTYYHLLSGTLPFLGESPMEIAIKRTKEDPRPLEHALPTADPRACAVVKKLLQRDAAQRYQSATDLMQDLEAILTNKPSSVLHASSSQNLKAVTTSKVVPKAAPPAALSVPAQRRIRSLIHWNLISLAVALVFLSAALAPRGAFLENWLAGEGDLGLRLTFLVASLLAGGGAVVIYRRELVYSGRFWALFLLVPLMLLGSAMAGALLAREQGSGPMSTLAYSARALAAGATSPASLLTLGLASFLVAFVISFEHEEGPLRILASRISMVCGFLLVAGFGASLKGLQDFFAHFLNEPEVSIPLGTVSILACFFGTVLATGYAYETLGRSAGVGLSLAGAIGLYAFVVVVSQPQRTSWLDVLGQPFEGFGRDFLGSGALLVVVAAIGFVMQVAVANGIRKQDRFYRKKQ